MQRSHISTAPYIYVQKHAAHKQDYTIRRVVNLHTAATVRVTVSQYLKHICEIKFPSMAWRLFFPPQVHPLYISRKYKHFSDFIGEPRATQICLCGR